MSGEADVQQSESQVETVRPVGEPLRVTRPPWLVVVLGACLFVLVLSSAGDYARQVVKDTFSEPAGVQVITNSLVSEPAGDGNVRVSVFVVLQNRDLKHEAESVRVAAHVSTSPGAGPILTATVARLAPNQTTAVIVRTTADHPAALQDVLVSVDHWVPQYPWSESPLGSLSVAKLSGSTDPVVARVTNGSGNVFRDATLVELAIDGRGNIAGGAQAAIPLLRGGQATTIRLPQDEAPGDLKRELYVQQG